jgi:hypothetical protein
VIITLGQTAPPIVFGTQEQQEAQAANIPFVPVRPLVRASMTTGRVRELIRVLTELLEKHDNLFESMKDSPS